MKSIFIRHKKRIASAIFGGLGVFFLLLPFVASQPFDVPTWVASLAIGFEALALALDPTILFERVSLQKVVNGKGFVRFGLAALLGVLAKVCFILAAIAWLLEEF